MKKSLIEKGRLSTRSRRKVAFSIGLALALALPAAAAGPAVQVAGEAVAKAVSKMKAATTVEERNAAWEELAALVGKGDPAGGLGLPAPGGPDDRETDMSVAGQPGEPDGELELTSRSSNALAGAFRRTSSFISFTSRVANKAGDVVAHVELNGHPFDVRSKPGSMRVDGHGYALSVEDRQALTALVREFERIRLGSSLDGTAPAHEDLLYRMLNMWSEAPVGLPHSVRVLRRSPAAGAPRGASAVPRALGD